MSVSLLDLYRSLGPVDARNVRRDPLLRWIGVLPFMLAAVYRMLFPWLTEVLRSAAGFDLEPYFPLIASSFVTAAPGVVGMVIGFLLIDERDEGVLTAVAVAPLRPSTFIAYRVSAPVVLGTATTAAAYPIVGLVPLRFGDLLVIAATASLLAPLTALFLAGFASNKVSGFAVVKVLNTINIAPVAAWFVAVPWQWAFGVVPAYWPMKMLWLAGHGEPYAGYAALALVVSAAWMALLLRRFRMSA